MSRHSTASRSGSAASWAAWRSGAAEARPAWPLAIVSAIRVSYAARAMWSGRASTWSPFSTRPMASAIERGISAAPRTIPATERGTYTSKRPVWSASTIALATSSGWTGLKLRVSGRPEPSSVLTTTGMTTLMSDVRAPQLGAQRLAEADDRVLGRAVGGAAGEAHLARGRGDLDEVAASARDEPLEREL